MSCFRSLFLNAGKVTFLHFLAHLHPPWAHNSLLVPSQVRTKQLATYFTPFFLTLLLRISAVAAFIIWAFNMFSKKTTKKKVIQRRFQLKWQKCSTEYIVSLNNKSLKIIFDIFTWKTEF